MPYLTANRKQQLDNNTSQPLATAGDLTYVLYCICAKQHRVSSVSEFNGLVSRAILRFLPEVPRYQDYAIVLGCLYATSSELVRRNTGIWGAHMLKTYARSYYANVVGLYENTKIEQNGDVIIDE